MSEELALAVKLGLAVKVLDPIWKPVATEIGDVLATPLKRWNAERKRKAEAILLEGVQLLSDRSLDPVVVPGRILWPILDFGSQLADDDVTLRHKWVAMLANAADPRAKVQVHPVFSKILSELTGADARVLDYLFERGVPRKGKLNPGYYDAWETLYQVPLLDLVPALGYTQPDLVVMLSHFYSLGICEPPGIGGVSYTTADGVNVSGAMYDTFFLTPLGVSFMTACKAPEGDRQG